MQVTQKESYLFSRIVYLALLAGVITGFVIAPIQIMAVQPFIQEAERYEQQGKTPTTLPNVVELNQSFADLDDANEPSQNKFERALSTTLVIVLMAIGYALILGACFSKIMPMNWRKGLAFGVAGFIVFQFAPALGLPPEPPGVPVADVLLRQLWWLATAIATATSLWLLSVSWNKDKKWLLLPAIALLALPHLVGAPQPPPEINPLPSQLMTNFITATLLTAALFWLLLGGLLGHLFKRYAKQ